MGSVSIQSLPKVAWLISYALREKAFNDAGLPRVLDATGFRVPVATAARAFARDRRVFNVDPARHQGKGIVYSWGAHELNPDDPADVAKAMRVAQRMNEKRFFMAASVLVAQADGKGKKLHIHQPLNNLVLEDCEVDGQRFKAGAALCGTITNIEAIRRDFDEACREEGVLQTNLPYEKGDRRTPSDRAARRAGKKSQSDFCKDVIEEVIALGIGADLRRFKYELAARGVELRVTPKVAGKYAGQTWLAYQREGAKGWTTDQHMGLERYGYDALMRDLAEPKGRKPRTVNPVDHEPKPLPELTEAERIESARVVQELAAGVRADRAAKREKVADRQARHEAEAAQQERDDALAAYVARVDLALWADEDVPWSEYEERYLDAMLAEQAHSRGEPVAARPQPQVVQLVQLDEDAAEQVPQLTEQEREQAEDELLTLRFRTVTEGASWSDEEYAAKLVRAEELRESRGIGADEQPPTPDEVIAAWRAKFGDEVLVAAEHIENADFGVESADLKVENGSLVTSRPETGRQRGDNGSETGSAVEGDSAEMPRNEETGSRRGERESALAAPAQNVAGNGLGKPPLRAESGDAADGIHTDPGTRDEVTSTRSADAPALAETEDGPSTKVTPAVDLSRPMVSSAEPDRTPADAPALAGSGGSAPASPPKPYRSGLRTIKGRTDKAEQSRAAMVEFDEYARERLLAGQRIEETRVPKGIGTRVLATMGARLHPSVLEQLKMREDKKAARSELFDQGKALADEVASLRAAGQQFSPRFQDLVAERDRVNRRRTELEEQIGAGVYEPVVGRWNSAQPPALRVALEQHTEDVTPEHEGLE